MRRHLAMGRPEWQSAILAKVQETLTGDSFWRSKFDAAKVNIHLSVFNSPYLDYILEGKKTVESRFSVVRCAPYGRVEEGDLLLLKESSGPVVGVCAVDRVWFYELDPATFEEIRETFSELLCADDADFWNSRRRAQYATLMQVAHAIRIDPIDCDKRDRRGWVVLDPQTKQQELHL